MAESLEKRQGRTAHAIHLLTTGGICLLRPGQTPFEMGSEEEAGFIAARETTYKDLLRTTLRKDSTSAIYFVGNHRFSIHTFTGVIYVDPGIVTHIGLGTFPHSTCLIIYDPMGRPINTVNYAGNAKIPG